MFWNVHFCSASHVVNSLTCSAMCTNSKSPKNRENLSIIPTLFLLKCSFYVSVICVINKSRSHHSARHLRERAFIATQINQCTEQNERARGRSRVKFSNKKRLDEIVNLRSWVRGWSGDQRSFGFQSFICLLSALARQPKASLIDVQTSWNTSRAIGRRQSKQSTCKLVELEIYT